MTNEPTISAIAGEREQQVLEEREPVVDLLGRGLAGGVAGLDLRRRRQQRLDLVGDLRPRETPDFGVT